MPPVFLFRLDDVPGAHSATGLMTVLATAAKLQFLSPSLRSVDAGCSALEFGFHAAATVAGPRGWIGVVLDTGPDWTMVASLVRDAYVHVATEKLQALLAGGR